MTTPIVKPQDLAYFHTTGSTYGDVLVPVKILSATGTASDPRFSARVTADRMPWVRGDMLHEVPARRFIARRTTTTRTVTRELLRAMRDVAGTHGPWVVSVKLSRAYGRRRYSLSYLKPWTIDGLAINLDVTRGELWVKPHNMINDPELEMLWDAMRPALETAVTIQHEHGEPITGYAVADESLRPYRLT